MNDLLKLLLILGVTVLLLAKRLDLGLVLGLNTILVAVLFRVPLAAWGRSVIRGLVALDTLSLAGPSTWCWCWRSSCDARMLWIRWSLRFRPWCPMIA